MLEEYKRKRNFRKTAEPEISSESQKGSSVFVVQKHAATHLHYDFRLEHDGVLKSWAVPKGPPFDPKDKRLAMMVEDHPYDYKDFEGVIPKGNYGAGRVIVWDRGTFRVKNTRDKKEGEALMEEQLSRGDLKIELFGEKLHGEFALVKIRKDPKGKSWLLIKKNDPEEKDGAWSEKSVLSGKTLDELGKKSAEEILAPYQNKLEEETLPTFLPPMTAKLAENPFSDPAWIFEIKWDGFRMIARRGKKSAGLYSRNQKSFKERFFPVFQELLRIQRQVILDGEIVVLDSSGQPKFQLLQDWQKSRQGIIRYYVFDILHLDGENLRTLPLIERKKILKDFLLAHNLSNFFYTDHIEEQGKEFFKQSVEVGLEGIMAKKKDSVYLSGIRSSDWLKIKNFRTQEAVIGGYTDPRGARKGFGALILGLWENGKLRFVGHVGGGFDEEKIEELKRLMEKYETSEVPFGVEPKTNAPARWLRPKLVCEVKFSEWSHDGLLRQPIFLRLREDKNSMEVKVEDYVK